MTRGNVVDCGWPTPKTLLFFSAFYHHLRIPFIFLFNTWVKIYMKNCYILKWWYPNPEFRWFYLPWQTTPRQSKRNFQSEMWAPKHLLCQSIKKPFMIWKSMNIPKTFGFESMNNPKPLWNLKFDLNWHVGRRCVHEGIQQVIIAHLEWQLHVVHDIKYNNLYPLRSDKKRSHWT